VRGWGGHLGARVIRLNNKLARVHRGLRYYLIQIASLSQAKAGEHASTCGGSQDNAGGDIGVRKKKAIEMDGVRAYKKTEMSGGNRRDGNGRPVKKDRPVAA